MKYMEPNILEQFAGISPKTTPSGIEKLNILMVSLLAKGSFCMITELILLSKVSDYSLQLVIYFETFSCGHALILDHALYFTQGSFDG